MKQFHTIEKIDTGILYTLELASSISILLLALRHVHRERTEVQHAAGTTSPPVPLMVPPELLDALRALLTQTIISEGAHTPHALPSPQAGEDAIIQAVILHQGEQPHLRVTC